MWLTTECTDVVVVEGELLQLGAAVKTLHFRNVIIIKGGPTQVHQLIQIDQFGDTLAVQIQGGDLVKSSTKAQQVLNMFYIRNYNCVFLNLTSASLEIIHCSPLWSSIYPVLYRGPRTQDWEDTGAGLLTADWDCGDAHCWSVSEPEEMPASRVSTGLIELQNILKYTGRFFSCILHLSMFLLIFMQ